MYVSFILKNIYPIVTDSFQIIIVFVNNGNATEDKNLP